MAKAPTLPTIIQATGRRKNATAMVNLIPGTGKITVNQRNFDDYFRTNDEQETALRPLIVSETRKTHDILVRAHGGGIKGQAAATSLAIARALVKIDKEKFHAALRKGGLLTRDSRMKERKKPGRPGARKRFQFSKR